MGERMTNRKQPEITIRVLGNADHPLSPLALAYGISRVMEGVAKRQSAEARGKRRAGRTGR